MTTTVQKPVNTAMGFFLKDRKTNFLAVAEVLKLFAREYLGKFIIHFISHNIIIFFQEYKNLLDFKNN